MERALRMRTIVARIAGFALIGGLAGFSAGCSTLESFIPKAPTPDSRSPRPQDPGRPEEAPLVLPKDALDIDCPEIEVQDGTSAMRVGGESNASVRYQFDITQTARVCQPAGDQFTIKVGVAGHLLIGPAGAPGAYSATLRVVVRREKDQSAVISKTYRVESNTAGGSLGSFQLVTEPFALPFPYKQVNQDYTILVGFDNGHGGLTGKAAPRRRHGQPAPVN
jgi:hypothetical protein